MWFLALVLAELAVEIEPKLRSLDRTDSWVTGFFDRGSGIWPASFGVLILCAGFFGLVVHVDVDSADWLYYSVEGGVGSYLLKRTFTLS